MTNKDYVLTSHARQRFHERKISIKDLEIALECPDISYEGKRGEINITKEIRRDRKLRAVYVQKGKKIVIITAMLKT